MDISSLQFPSRLDQPKFEYGNGVTGNPQKAKQSYASCILGGGNSVDCGASAWESGLNSAIKINEKKTPSWVDKWKCVFSNSEECRAMQDDFESEISDLKKSKGSGLDVGSIWDWINNPTRIIVVIIGIILIASALFMMGISSYNPTSIVKEAIK